MKKTTVLILSCFFQINALAEPSKSVAYLMSEPVSMFEWGLYRVEKSLLQLNFDDLDLVYTHYSETRYDQKANQINIKVTIYPSYQSIAKDGARKICQLALSDLKQYFGFGITSQFRRTFGINTYFEHQGFSHKNMPRTLEEDLENMTRLQVEVFASENNKPNFSKQSVCSSMLLEKSVYFGGRPDNPEKSF